ncbi:MAG: bacteriohemerythrin [Verrucomicrobia bacterium]|nr:bacteriohemerythrin [Verrucomicrobiota bacterium]
MNRLRGGIRRQIATVVVLAISPVLLALVLLVVQVLRMNYSRTEQHKSQTVLLAATDKMARFRDMAVADARFLVYIPPVSGLLRATDHGGVDPRDGGSAQSWINRMAEIFSALANARQVYDQVRFIDADGMERVRVNWAAGHATVVPTNELQSKKDRYYFTETARLKAGECYISAIDLNRERGQVEVPHKPMLRVGAPVFDDAARFRGIIVLNVLAEPMLHGPWEQLEDEAHGYWFIADQTGAYLHHSARPDNEWGGPVDLDTGHGMAEDLADAFVEARQEGIVHAKIGGQACEVFTQKLAFWPEPDRFLVVGHVVPQSVIHAPLRRSALLLSGLLLMVIACAAGGAAFAGRRIARPIQELSSSMDRFAKGERDARCTYEGSAQIGALVTSFNVMAATISDQRDQLEGEIAARRLNEVELIRHRDHLDTLVSERTSDLDKARKAAVSLAQDAEAQRRLAEGALADLKRSEVVLRQSEERLNRAQEIAHLGSWELDLTRNELTWSDEVYRIFGLAPQEFAATYEAFLDFVHPEDRTAVDAAYGDSVREGRDGYEIEHRIVRRGTGEIRWVQERCSHARDASGRIVRSLGMVHDITERKRQEAVIREQQQILTLIVEQTLAGSWDWFIQEQRLVMSSRLKASLGYEDHEVPNTQEAWQKLVHPDDLPAVFAAFNQHVESRGQTPYNPEVRYRHKNGSLQSVICTGMVIQWDADGKPVRMVGCHADITARKQMESALRDAKEAAEAANQAKSDFLASMSHELRTPLNAIIGFSEVLEDRTFGELNPKQAKYVDHVLGAGRHLLSLINDILDLSKVEAGKMELEPARFRIKGMLEDGLTLIKEKAYKHGLSVELTAPDDLTVTADERMLKQVMFNLLSNAVKFTPEGGSIRVSAEVSSDQAPSTSHLPPSNLLISVSDTGIGIKKEDQGRLFGEFVQLDSGADRKHQGTGLGLALSRKFVELHGGRLWVESEGVDKGSTFRFVIPLEKPHEGAMTARRPALPLARIEWKDEYSVGVAHLDEWHRRIFGTINRLIDLRQDPEDPEAIRRSLDEMVQYSKEHFRDEETLMQEWSYSGLADQQREHQTYLTRIAAFETGARREGERLCDSMLADLHHWWTHHVVEEDMRYKAFFAEKGVR